ncbi:hypothetical protein [Cellulomonas sp.]|uniref:hypothetical protein n=1 Tax=Cellulomonas sp. TaxID=40001 RepID=UPI001B26C085|nr:hypothetical protein [Cellulomonas sp.]MBO9553607.1 hypothetical protein [Cellulomonas sp.]
MTAQYVVDPDAPLARPQEVAGVRVVLPATWWAVDLRDEAARRRSIATLVGQQLGRGDELAALRADLRRHLEVVAIDAAALGGQLLAISLTRAGPVPIPASVAVYRALAGDRARETLANVEAALRAEPATSDTVDAAQGPHGPVLRRTRTASGAAEIGAQDVPMLLADYWLDLGDGAGLVSLTFSSPLVEAREALLPLFDTVVASVTPVTGSATPTRKRSTPA